MTTAVVVRLQVEGFHRWADCPLPEVIFLRDRHRHVFHITAHREVAHADRDVEIIMLKREMEQWLERFYGRPCEFGSMSCEMIAARLVEAFGLRACWVLEDGENGAVVGR